MNNWDKATEVEERGTAKFKAAYENLSRKDLANVLDYIYRVSELKVELANSFDEIDRLKRDIDKLKSQIK